jgi:hypothetical protein
MPSVEILVEQFSEPEMVFPEEYSFAIKMTTPPVSDRMPSLWQSRFQAIGGTLIQLGEPRFKEDKDGWFFAYDLLDISQSEHFQFKKAYFSQVFELLAKLLRHSKVHTIHFTSDWQFGPKSAESMKHCIVLEDFITKHNKTGLRFNTWFTIQENCKSDERHTKGQT